MSSSSSTVSPRSRSTGSRPARQSEINRGMSRCGTAEPRQDPFQGTALGDDRERVQRQIARGVGEPDRDGRASARGGVVGSRQDGGLPRCLEGVADAEVAGLVRVECCGRADLEREFTLELDRVDRDERLCAGESGSHHGGEPDAAESEDRDRVAGANARRVQHGAGARDDRAAEERCDLQRNGGIHDDGGRSRYDDPLREGRDAQVVVEGNARSMRSGVLRRVSGPPRSPTRQPHRGCARRPRMWRRRRSSARTRGRHGRPPRCP